MQVLKQLLLKVGNYFQRLRAGGTQTADRILTIDLGNADRTLTFTGDATIPGGVGTVTSVDVTPPAAGITASGGPVTTSGAITLALADDLAALEALSGTSTIYYRSGASAWSAVTIGANLTFVAGTLAAGGGTGTVTSVAAGAGVVCTPDPITATGTVAVDTGTSGHKIPYLDGLNTWGDAQVVSVETASGSGLVTATQVRHTTTATAADGFGVAYVFSAEAADGSNYLLAAVNAYWASASAKRGRADLVTYLANVAATGLSVGQTAGGAATVSFLGATPSAQLVSPDLGTLATTFGLASGTPTFAAANLTGTTLPAAIVTSSLTTIGTLVAGSVPVSLVGGLGANVATFLATPSSANLRAALTDEAGTGAAYFVGGALGTPASGVLSNCTGYPLHYVLLRDEKGATTEGGSNTGGSYQTRTLNTESADAGGVCSLASNQFTLTAGTYLIRARAPAYRVGRHQIKLRNATAAADLIIGTPAYSENANNVQGWAWVEGRFTVAAAQALEIQHYTTTSVTTQGFGLYGDGTNASVYTVVELWREL